MDSLQFSGARMFTNHKAENKGEHNSMVAGYQGQIFALVPDWACQQYNISSDLVGGAMSHQLVTKLHNHLESVQKLGIMSH